MLDHDCIPSKPGMKRVCVCMYVAILDFILGRRGLVPLPESPWDSSHSTLMCLTLALFTCNLSFQTSGALQEALNLPLPHSALGLFCVLWSRHRENLLPFCLLAAIHMCRCTCIWKPENYSNNSDPGISRAGLKGLVPPWWCQGALGKGSSRYFCSSWQHSREDSLHSWRSVC